jgi:short-subunit dehydrogenase/hemerythrin-like domain-containing protein
MALITGASTGIGYELAIEFATHGFDLIIVAENDEIYVAKEALSESGVYVVAIKADLRNDAGLDEVISYVQTLNRPLDAVALNAGVGLAGAFLGGNKLEDEMNMINLNVIAVVKLAKALIAPMVKKGEGKVLFTTCMASLTPGPFQAVYHASKAFIQTFLDAVREEIRGSGVTITALMPGATETQFYARADMLETKMGQAIKADPAQVARQGFEALMRGEDLVIGGSLLDKVYGITTKFMSDAITSKQSRSDHERVDVDQAVDAIMMLTRQHREAETLFDRIQNSTPGEGIAIFKTLSEKLREHIRIEEMVLYPAVRKIDRAEVKHAEYEHDEIKALLQSISMLKESPENFERQMTELKKSVQHHVEEEEQNLFPLCESEFSREKLVNLGDQMRKMTVKDQLKNKPTPAPLRVARVALAYRAGGSL